MLGRGNSVAAGRIQDNDAAARGGLNVDIVHANTGPTDSAKIFRRIKDVGGDFCLTSNNNCTEFRDDVDEVGFF